MRPANTLRLAGKHDDALVYYARAAALPGGDPLALFQRAMALSSMDREAEALASVEESIAQHPFPAAYVLKIFFLLDAGGLTEAKATLAKVPPSYFVEPRCALAAARVWEWDRQPDKVIAALAMAPDFFSDSYYRGPKGLLIGEAHRQAGRHAAAATEWQAALKVVDDRLAASGNNPELHLRKAHLLARLGRQPEADRTLQVFEELANAAGNIGPRWTKWAVAEVDVALSKHDEAIALLREVATRPRHLAELRQSPAGDPLRKNPRFEALLEQRATKK